MDLPNKSPISLQHKKQSKRNPPIKISEEPVQQETAA